MKTRLLDMAAPEAGRRSSRAGFTLMELIVASLITSIVMAGVYTALSSAIMTWHTGEAGIRNYQGARISMALMEEELQCTIPGAEQWFEGDANQVQFFAVTRPMDVKEGEHPRIMRVRYRLKEDPDNREKILVREEAVVKGPFPTREKEDRDEIDTNPVKLGKEESFEMATGLKGIKFTYYWVPSPEQSIDLSLTAKATEPTVLEENRAGWGLPQGIKIVLTVSDPNSESRQTSFTSFVAFQGPTTQTIGGRPDMEGML